MKRLLILVVINLATFIHAKKGKHLTELLDNEHLKKVVKRFDDLQFDPSNAYETVVPVKNHHNGYNYVSVKSNIPEEPPTNQFDDEQSNEIPVGPVEQTDTSPRLENGGANVQLKDLLSFIRKTNIPEDPFHVSERSQILPQPDYYTSDNHARNFYPADSMNSKGSTEGIYQAKRYQVPQLNLETLNTKNIPLSDGMYPAKRFQVPQLSLDTLSRKNSPPSEGIYPVAKRFQGGQSAQQLQQQLLQQAWFNHPQPPYRFNVKKAEIPKAPSIKETDEAIFPDTQTGDEKSDVTKPKSDPYDELRKAISKKEEIQQYLITTIQAHTKPAMSVTSETKPKVTFTVQKASVPSSVTNRVISRRGYIAQPMDMQDPYEKLKQAIKRKEESFAQNQRRNVTSIRKKSRIPSTAEYLMQYNEFPINDKTDERAAAVAFIHQMNTNYINNLNRKSIQKKAEIPGITIEHSLPKDSYPLNLRKIPMQIRKDSIPDNENKNQEIVEDANNEIEYKKSDIPKQNNNDIQQQDDNQLTAQEGNNFETEESEKEIEEETGSPKSELPTAEDLERVKIDREMKLAEELNKMKKSKIPYSSQQQQQTIIKPTHVDSYSVQLRKYPAEGILRQEIPKRQNYLKHAVNKTLPSLKEIIKRFEIPQTGSPFTTIPTEQEFQQTEGPLPDINNLIQSRFTNKMQEHEQLEEQIQEEEQKQEQRLWQQQKDETARHINEEGLRHRQPENMLPFLNHNNQLNQNNQFNQNNQNEENEGILSPLESFKNFIKSNGKALNIKKSNIPLAGKEDDANVSPDSYPLVLRKWPPNRRSLETEKDE